MNLSNIIYLLYFIAESHPNEVKEMSEMWMCMLNTPQSFTMHFSDT